MLNGATHHATRCVVLLNINQGENMEERLLSGTLFAICLALFGALIMTWV